MTFFFYDLETTGINPRWQRIMQFAGQRTDEELKPIGDPINLLVKITDEILPDPQAILVTGITPQQTLQDGITEAAFTAKLQKEVFTKGTVALGYNSIRFDDEFIRHTLFRNYYDPYEREWADERARWDILDAVRMMRALRPEGLEWATNSAGKPSNRLEAIAEANDISHPDAHDALGDVRVTIEIARRLKSAQPKLFEHLFSLRDKRVAAELLDIDNPKPLVHSSGKFSSDHLSTSVIIPIGPHPVNSNAVLVYDLRYSPLKFKDYDAVQLAEATFTPLQELMKADKPRLPVKAVHVNKSPALAPLGVLDEASQERINLSVEQIETHLKELASLQGFGQRVYQAWNSQPPPEPPEDVEGQLYEGFIGDDDKKKLRNVHSMTEDQLSAWQPRFNDERLNEMFVRFKARNFPHLLSGDERQLWEQYRAGRLSDSSRGHSLKTYFNELAKLATEHAEDSDKMFLLEELQLYGQSIMPFETEQLL